MDTVQREFQIHLDALSEEEPFFRLPALPSRTLLCLNAQAWAIALTHLTSQFTFMLLQQSQKPHVTV